MGLPITAPADYIGPVNISQAQFKANDLKDYITEFEPQYLRDVLNDLIFSEISAQPTLEKKYTDLIDGVTYINDEGDTVINKGLKSALKYWIYYHFVSDNFINSGTGNTINHNENSNIVPSGANTQIAYSRWNEGVRIYECDIFPFIQFYSSISTVITSSVDNGGGNYTINLPSTLYLVDGDTVTINGIDYIISTLVANVSFDISGAALGLDFAGDSVIYEPFANISFNNFGRAWL